MEQCTHLESKPVKTKYGKGTYCRNQCQTCGKLLKMIGRKKLEKQGIDVEEISGPNFEIRREYLIEKSREAFNVLEFQSKKTEKAFLEWHKGNVDLDADHYPEKKRRQKGRPRGRPTKLA